VEWPVIHVDYYISLISSPVVHVSFISELSPSHPPTGRCPFESGEMLIHGSTLALSVLCLSWTPTVLYNLLSCPGNSQQTSHPDDEPPTPETSTTAEQVKRVAIIGAGTAGLAALKTFIHDIPKPDGQRWEVELFERRNGLGGIWSVPRFFTHC
jgi:hypothetical protein